VTVMPSCSGGGNVVVECSSSLKPLLEFELRSSCFLSGVTDGFVTYFNASDF
jgi:hypothetical protein